MRSETPRSTTGTRSSGPADRKAHRCDKRARRVQVSTDHTDKSSTLGIEKMRTRKYSPSNEDAYRNSTLYYWYLLQWPGSSQGTPLWYACKARPGADKPREQLRHAGDPPPSFNHRSIQSSGMRKTETIPHSLHTPSTLTRLARPFFLVVSLSCSFCSWAAVAAASGLNSAMAWQKTSQ